MALRGAEGNQSVVATVFAAETVIVTVGPVDVPADSTRAVILATCLAATAAGVTTSAGRIRRGLLATDPLVILGATLPFAASSAGLYTISAVDLLTVQATVAYCLTLTSGGGNSTNVIATISILFV